MIDLVEMINTPAALYEGLGFYYDRGQRVLKTRWKTIDITHDGFSCSFSHPRLEGDDGSRFRPKQKDIKLKSEKLRLLQEERLLKEEQRREDAKREKELRDEKRRIENEAAREKRRLYTARMYEQHQRMEYWNELHSRHMSLVKELSHVPSTRAVRIKQIEIAIKKVKAEKQEHLRG